jgi:hypothetical protein
MLADDLLNEKLEGKCWEGSKSRHRGVKRGKDELLAQNIRKLVGQQLGLAVWRGVFRPLRA